MKQGSPLSSCPDDERSSTNFHAFVHGYIAISTLVITIPVMMSMMPLLNLMEYEHLHLHQVHYSIPLLTSVNCRLHPEKQINLSLERYDLDLGT